MIRADTLSRYLGRQIYAAVAFVLAGFLALFAFFDLINELGDLDKGAYSLRVIAAYVVLSVPAHAYELLPVAVLIGTLYTLAHLASNSEYTVMRVSGLAPLAAARILMRIGVAFVVATLVIGEWVAPYAEESAQSMRMRAMSSLIGQGFQSGVWLKDGRSFINFKEARSADSVAGVRIFEFDAENRLLVASEAERARYVEPGRWELQGVAQTRMTPQGPRVERHAALEWRSEVNPDLLNVLVVDPGRMSIWALYKYVRHLSDNRQKTERYEIALWKKVFYPFATLVMMALALPFAYLHARAGMVGVKVFSGIMLGIFFHMLNNLFAHVGLLQNWPPLAAALVPSAAFLMAAMAMMWRAERR